MTSPYECGPSPSSEPSSSHQSPVFVPGDARQVGWVDVLAAVVALPAGLLCVPVESGQKSALGPGQHDAPAASGAATRWAPPVRARANAVSAPLSVARRHHSTSAVMGWPAPCVSGGTDGV